MEKEDNNNNQQLEFIDKGFTKIPNVIFNAILFNNLLQRDLEVILFIFRLTYGCRDQKWAILRQCDLQIIRISETHAKEVLGRLLQRNIIVQNNKTNEFRVNENCLISKAPKRGHRIFEKLRALIGKQLFETSLDGKVELPETGSSPFPQEEVPTSQIGNFSYFPNQEVLASNNKGFATPKDILKRKKYSDKDIFADNNFSSNRTIYDPKSFVPKNDGQAAALTAWEALEPHNPLAFTTTYLATYNKGLPTNLFYIFVSEIKQSNVKNPGAVFQAKAKEWVKNKKEGVGNG
ncbi:replication protein [Candidatus Gottesmanbacteria bacterium]|nr:replication protein [Candidatus Gottesmanbacteria bacterium]